jgi:hypothetical protein
MAGGARPKSFQDIPAPPYVKGIYLTEYWKRDRLNRGKKNPKFLVSKVQPNFGSHPFLCVCFFNDLWGELARSHLPSHSHHA